MPKIVDHDAQRRIVAEAAMRVIQQSGLEQATVRKVAKEAGLSVGSMRYYFSSQVELFAFCMNLVVERVEDRLSAYEFQGPILQDVKRILLQLLPIDEERSLEMEVWFTFHSKMLVHSELQKLSFHVHDGIYRVSRFVLEEMARHKLLRPGLDLDTETEKLYAFVDGLAIHRLLHPERLPVGRLDMLLDSYLKSLWV
jgi:AcrR family transcriptional regulator